MSKKNDNIIFYRTKGGRLRWFDKNSDEYKSGQIKKANLYSYKEVTKKLKEDSVKLSKKLTNVELHFLRKYTKNSLDNSKTRKEDKYFDLLNKHLRLKARGLKVSSEKLDKEAEHISSAISKYELEDDIVCFRRSNTNVFEGAEPGMVVKLGHFLSTSTDRNSTFNGKYMVYVIANKRSKCAPLHAISRYPEQNEMLFDKSCKYRILFKKGYKMFVEVVT